MMIENAEELQDLLAEALTPGGACRLPFDQMLRVLEAGQAQGLILFTVDVTNADGTRPHPEWMFRLTDAEAAATPAKDIIPMALNFYRDHTSDGALSSAAFEVYFEPAD